MAREDGSMLEKRRSADGLTLQDGQGSGKQRHKLAQASKVETSRANCDRLSRENPERHNRPTRSGREAK